MVKRFCRTVVNNVAFEFIPKWEPDSTDPYHLHILGSRALMARIREFKPDVVHGHGTENVYGLVAARQSCPNVISLQGIIDELRPYYPRSWLKFTIQRRLERVAVRKAQALIAKTSFAERWARQINKTSPIFRIPNAVNTEFLRVSPRYSTPKILCIGSINHNKNQACVIRSMAALRDKEVMMDIIGTGPHTEQCRALAKALGVGNQVNFRGHLSPAEIASEMETVRLLVLASFVDTSPNVVCEAQAAGLPVVATEAGGIPDMVDDGIDGFVVPLDDAQALSERIRRLVHTPELCRAMGSRGRDKVRKRNDPSRIADLHVQCYRQLCQRSMV
jgi:glycosyltransferase involved in cell wall biosynthesis